MATNPADYLHFTKRLGLIAVSQYPIQYLLSLKSLNLFAFALGSSHEYINRYHRVLGRILAVLVTLHVILYLNFLYRAGTLSRRLQTPLVASGLVSFILLNLLYTTALRPLRQVSYRVFFLVHLIVAFVTPLTLSQHAPSGRIFLVEAIAVFVADLISRKLDTVTSEATLEPIPGTSLVKITAAVPFTKINRFRLHPGSHVYLSVPAAARKTLDSGSMPRFLFEFLFNPFTVATVDPDHNTITLVARRREGSMTKALADLARGTRSFGSSSGSPQAVHVPLSVEGPYGVATRFPHLSSSDFDRILLVAGGVGATFILPLYRSIVGENPNAPVEVIWSVRAASDATWAITDSGDGSGLFDDRVNLFFTGNAADSFSPSSAAAHGGGDVELTALYRDRRRGRFTAGANRRRPDLKKIVDEVFRHGLEERVAVLVCGPHGMSRELREHVGVWVDRGRTVWWHEEGFGF